MAIHTYSLIPSYNAGGQFCQNVLHYQFDDSSYGDTASAALALINAFDAARTAGLQAIIPTSTAILSYKSRCLTAVGGFEAVKVLSGINGSRTGVLAVAGVSPVCVLIPTANAKPRGRVFLPGVTDSDLTDGEFATGFRNTVNTNADVFTGTLNLAGGATPVATPVIYPRLNSPGSSYAVEYMRLSDLPGTQRRRQRPA